MILQKNDLLWCMTTIVTHSVRTFLKIPYG